MDPKLTEQLSKFQSVDSYHSKPQKLNNDIIYPKKSLFLRFNKKNHYGREIYHYQNVRFPR